MILSDKAIMSLLQDSQIQPASVDIRLGNTFSIVEDSSAPILTFTQEMAYKEMHAEKYLLLQAGRRIGQLVFARMDQAALHPYRGKYQGQRGATGSRVYLDEESHTYRAIAKSKIVLQALKNRDFFNACIFLLEMYCML